MSLRQLYDRKGRCLEGRIRRGDGTGKTSGQKGAAVHRLAAGPPARVFDKPGYSAFAGPRLCQHLQERGAGTLIVTGSETGVCVLPTVIGAVDHGYRVILVS